MVALAPCDGCFPSLYPRLQDGGTVYVPVGWRSGTLGSMGDTRHQAGTPDGELIIPKRADSSPTSIGILATEPSD